MNSNSHLATQQEFELRKAVEQQLDLILKMQQERKALKKQNKLLTQQLKSATSVLTKYRVQTAECETNTDEVGEEVPKEKNSQVELVDQSIQVENQNNLLPLNCSKLTEAQSLLRALDQTQNQSKLEQKTLQEVPRQGAKKTQNNSKQQISAQIVKMSKQINSLKRQLKDAHQKYGQRDKEIRDLKKCLQTKNEALEKSRKDFNQLSILMNSDKYKSIRQLEQQVTTLRAKVAKSEDSVKLKKVLEGLTEEYQDYKKGTEKKIDILVNELASKQKQNEELKDQHKRVSRQLQSLTRNQE